MWAVLINTTTSSNPTQAMGEPEEGLGTRLSWVRSHLVVAVVTALSVASAMAARTSLASAVTRAAPASLGVDATGASPFETGRGSRSDACNRHSLRVRDTTLGPGLTYVYLAGEKKRGAGVSSARASSLCACLFCTAGAPPLPLAICLARAPRTERPSRATPPPCAPPRPLSCITRTPNAHSQLPPPLTLLAPPPSPAPPRTGVEGSGHHALMSVIDALLDDRQTAANGTGLMRSEGVPVLFVPRSEAKPVNTAAWALWRNDDAGKHKGLVADFNAALRLLLLSGESSSVAAGVTEGGVTTRRILFGPFTESGEPLSYPFGVPRNAVSRPVLEDVVGGCARVGIGVKMVVLHRDPIAATYSRIRQMRELKGHALLQGRIVLDNMQAVAREMGALECDAKVVIR